jgi:hypothetical protein
LLITGIPAMGMRAPKLLLSPKTSLDERTSGRMVRGTSKILSNSSSQSPFWMLKSIVRDALLGSVMCWRPPVRFQTSQESTCRKQFAGFAAAFAPGTFLRIHWSFVPEK